MADDCVETAGVLDLSWSDFQFDLALIGGGNIVSTLRTSLPAYREVPGLDSVAYPSLWLSACLRAAEIGAAIAWNAPGVMQPVWSGAAQTALELSLAHSDYVAFREADRLAVSDYQRSRLSIVPDTAVVLPRIWPRETILASLFDDLLRTLGLTRPYFLVHFKARNAASISERLVAAKAIDDFALQTGLVPVLVPVGRCHGDDDFLRLLATDMRVGPVLAHDITGLKAITSLIAHARYVVTASLHCAIVAAAYGAPVSLLATRGNPKYRAFFEGHLGIAGLVHDDIQTCLTRWTMDDLTGRGAEMAMAVAEANAAVDAHFVRMKRAAARPGNRAVRGAAFRSRLAERLTQQAPLSRYLPIGATT